MWRCLSSSSSAAIPTICMVTPHRWHTSYTPFTSAFVDYVPKSFCFQNPNLHLANSYSHCRYKQKYHLLISYKTYYKNFTFQTFKKTWYLIWRKIIIENNLQCNDAIHKFKMLRKTSPQNVPRRQRSSKMLIGETNKVMRDYFTCSSGISMLAMESGKV